MLVGAGQFWPNEGASVENTVTRGRLVVVATPLGNLGDISRRALDLLASADLVYCEDTRRSSTLFSAHSIPVRGRLRALHEHNEASLCEEVVGQVSAGRVVVIVSDAGTPGISDPGSRLVAAVAAAGLEVTTAPGPSAVVAALSVSGLATERFCMEGFVARKAGDRERLYAQWARETRTIVFFESPQRLGTTLTELAGHYPERRVCVARELTKLHEEVLRGTLAEVASLIGTREVLGEVVVVLAGAPPEPPVGEDVIRSALADQSKEGATTRDAVAFVAESLGVTRRVVYRLELERRADERG